MGIKKRVTMTVEVVMDIDLPEWANNPTAQDIEGINYCGFDVENSDDIYKEACRLVLLGYADSNNDVFGYIRPMWRKDTKHADGDYSFYDIDDLYVEDCSVELVGGK